MERKTEAQNVRGRIERIRRERVIDTEREREREREREKFSDETHENLDYP